MSYHELFTENITRMVKWDDRRLQRIVRFRLRKQGGVGLDGQKTVFIVVYCHGKMVDGEYVRVFLPFRVLGPRWKIELVDFAKRDGVHAKNLGIFDAASFADE